MNAPRTPDEILHEIGQLRSELMRGSQALYESELAAERAEEAAKLAEGRVFMTAEGSIPDRQVRARAESASERDASFIARAEYNRVRSKIRGLESGLTSLQTELKWAREAGA